MTKEETREQLRKAIVDHLVAIDLIDPSIQILNDFCVVGHVLQIVGNGKSTYASIYNEEEMPYHSAVGLHYTAIDLLQEEGTEDGD